MSAVLADIRAARPWRVALPAVLVLLAAVLLLYRDTAAAMVEIWSRSATFTHAYLVLPITLWLVWRRRAELAALVPRPQPLVVPLMLLVALGWLLADLAVVNAASQFALVALLVLSVPALLGTEVALAILFPLSFLFFAVPFGEFALPWLMEWTADFTIAALHASGIPVYREGLQFVIPSGSWSVVEACSGVRYLIASFMVGTLFAYLNYRSNRRRALFMLVAIAVPIVANWVRAYCIVLLGHLSGNTIAVGVDHLIYGWLFFGVVVTLMFGIGARWAEPAAAPSAPVAGMRRFATAARRPWPAAAGTAATLAAALLVACLPQLAANRLQQQQAAAPVPRLALPAQLAAGWSADATATTRSSLAPTLSWRPSIKNPSADAARAYRSPPSSSSSSPSGTVGVYLAYYRTQSAARKLVSSENMLVTSDDHAWNKVVEGRRDVVTAGGLQVAVQTAELLGSDTAGNARNGQRTQLTVWRLYWVDGRWVGSDAGAKVSTLLSQLRGHGDDGAVLVLHAGEETPAASEALLAAFAAANLGALDALLRSTHDDR